MELGRRAQLRGEKNAISSDDKTHNYPTLWKDPAELGVQPKGPGIMYADPQLSRVKTSKDPVTPPPRYVV